MLSPLTFTLASLALLAAPGPTNALLASAGAAIGWRAWRLIIIEAVGYGLAVGILVLLLGPTLATLPNVVIGLKYIVAAWLVWTGIDLWRHGGKAVHIEDKSELWKSTNRRDKLIRKRIMFVTTLLNPKTLVFAFGLMPGAETGTANVLWHLAGLCGLTMMVGSCWLTLGAIIGRAGAAPYVARTTAVALGVFSALLVGSTF